MNKSLTQITFEFNAAEEAATNPAEAVAVIVPEKIEKLEATSPVIAVVNKKQGSQEDGVH